jgi:Uma2 family endonuclease
VTTHTFPPLDVNIEKEKYYEFVDGQYVERVIGNETHSELQLRVTNLLRAIANARRAKALQEWTIAHGEDWLIPDVLVTFPDRSETDKRGYLISIPFLCVEIVSPGQSEAELFRKCYRYSEWGVPHCWIIDPQAQACFEYHGGRDFVLVEPEGFLTAGDVHLATATIFAED